MTDITVRIERLKAQLHALTDGSPSAVPHDLQRKQDIELTYSSNAIEGNTLTHGETAELIEHGLVAGGKTLKEHQEITDHYQALQWMRDQVAKKAVPDENMIVELHRRTMLTSRGDIAGFYAQYGRRISGSPVVFPNRLKVPDLMQALGQRISSADDRPEAAFDAHYRLVTIHPFDDGNGRTARLLTNFMLLKAGYVPVSVRPEDRTEYRETLKEAQISQDESAPAFQAFMHRRLEAALQEHISDIGQGRQHGAEPKRSDDKQEADEPSGRSSLSAAQMAHLAQLHGKGR